LQSESVSGRATGPAKRLSLEIAGTFVDHPSISREPVFSVNSGHSNKERRRSERLFEALPLIVRGSDLLGQPFEERTSTLSFNLHGCQYTSKHHLPRNSWVTLELPDAHSNVRARVAWVQRPHSIRDFFQIAVELERPTNVWKRGTLPENWMKAETSFPSEAFGHTGVTAHPLTSTVDDTGAGSVATTLGHFMNATFRDSSRDAGLSPASESEDAHPLLRDLRANFERNESAASPALPNESAPTTEASTADMSGVSNEGLAEIEKQMRAFQTEIEQMRTRIQGDFTELMNQKAREMAEGLRAEMESNSARAHELLNQLNRQSEQLRSEQEAAQQATSRVAQARLQLEAIEASRAARPAIDVSKELVIANDRATADWRKRLESEMAIAQSQWNELLQSSLDSNLKKMIAQLSERSADLVRSTEQRMTEKLDDWREPFAQAASEARSNLTDIQAKIAQEVAQARGSLADVEQAAGRTKEFSSQIEAATHDTLNELHRRLDTILNSQTSEMNRRAEGIANALTQRLAPALDSIGQQFMERNAAEMETKLAPHMERLPGLIRDLNSREAQAEESLRLHRERLRQASENNQREAAAQMAAAIANLQNDFENARKQALAQWTEELDATGVRAAHATAESMGRSSEWFQQEARARLQVLVEQELVNAGATFSSKTDEAAQKFATTLSDQSGAHLEHARSQVEAVAVAASEKARSQVELAAQAAAASFGTVLQGVSAQELEQFNNASRGLVQQRTQEFENTSRNLLDNLNQNATQSLEQFRAHLSSHLENSLNDGRNSLGSHFSAAMEQYRAEQNAHQQDWARNLDHLRGDAAQKFQEHLQDTSDTWIASSMRRLNEHGQNGIESLLRNADQALREAFSKVFEGLAETLRDRAVGAAAGASGVAGFAPIPARDTETSGPRNEII
jgi:gas vesicle protein